MGENREKHAQGTRDAGAQAADLRAVGRDEGALNSVGSGSAQTVQLTGYSEESIRRWIRKGALPIERVGPYRRVRVRFSVLRRLFPR
jgi:hypothetical protein